MSDNRKVLEEGRKRMREIIDRHLLECITEMGIKLIHDGVISAQYHNLTGNTLTSLAVGIYHRGALKRIITAVTTQGLKNPTRNKLTRGDGIGVVMARDYDSGKLVHIKKYALIDTDERYGLTTSVNFLNSYKAPSDSIGLVMCTGTEYSSFLESKKGLNVLTDTFDYTEAISKMSLKPMKS